MADVEEETTSESIDQNEELLARHRKEKKELQAKVQALKKTATKGDKKKKKEVADEIAKLESDMEARHLMEEKQLKDSTVEQNLCDDLEANLTTGNLKEEVAKVTKAQKRRDRKLDQAKERERLIEEQEKANLQGMRHIETEKIKKILAAKNLSFFEIPSDGNCMYAAILHQLNQGASAQQRTVQQLRNMTAEFMRSHPEEFTPFMDDVTNDVKFSKYCDDVQRTQAWGGQLELRALSQVLRRPFEVVQAEGRPVVLGEEFIDSSSPTVILTYHRHMFGLGEHYNSVQPRKADEEEEPF